MLVVVWPMVCFVFFSFVFLLTLYNFIYYFFIGSSPMNTNAGCYRGLRHIYISSPFCYFYSSSYCSNKHVKIVIGSGSALARPPWPWVELTQGQGQLRVTWPWVPGSRARKNGLALGQCRYSRVRVWVGNLDPHQTPTPIRAWWGLWIWT